LHGDSIKKLEGLKEKFTALQSTTRQNETAAETAKAMLKTSEESWQKQKESLDKEIAALTSRYAQQARS
jgi:nucleoprotein TPR